MASPSKARWLNRELNMMKSTLVLTSLPYLSLSFVINWPIAPLPSQNVALRFPNVRHAAHRHCFHVESLGTTSNLLQLKSPHAPSKPKVRIGSPLQVSSSSDIAMSTDEGIRWAEGRFPGCKIGISQVSFMSCNVRIVIVNLVQPSHIRDGGN